MCFGLVLWVFYDPSFSICYQGSFSSCPRPRPTLCHVMARCREGDVTTSRDYPEEGSEVVSLCGVWDLRRLVARGRMGVWAHVSSASLNSRALVPLDQTLDEPIRGRDVICGCGRGWGEGMGMGMTHIPPLPPTPINTYLTLDFFMGTQL